MIYQLFAHDCASGEVVTVSLEAQEREDGKHLTIGGARFDPEQAENLSRILATLLRGPTLSRGTEE